MCFKNVNKSKMLENMILSKCCMCNNKNVYAMDNVTGKWYCLKCWSKT